VREAAGSLDTLGLMARSIEDIALYRDVLLGQPASPLPPEPRRPRIGFCRTSRWDTLEPSTAAMLEQAARTLAAAGAQVTEIVLPEEFGRVVDAHRWVSSFEFTRNFRHEIANHADRISTTLREGRIRDGLSCSFERYLESRTFLEQCRLRLPDACSHVDLLLTASCDGEAPVGLNTTGNPYFSALWTALHVPCLTAPVFTGPAGLPVGVQLIGHRNRDRDLLDAARWVVAALA